VSSVSSACPERGGRFRPQSRRVVNVRRHGIESVSAEWMAAAQPLRAEPAAADDAEARDRLGHVIRAAGRVAAAAGKERR
jgi:hypothetical protein